MSGPTHILPANASALERAVDQTATADWASLPTAARPVGTDHVDAEPTAFHPWLAAEWGLADFADHFVDATELVRSGVPWLLERGTAAAVKRALGWMGLENANMDEDGAYLHIDIGRPASDAELLAVARLVRPSIPAHVRFYRVFHAWDLRHARADHSRWDGALWDNGSGVWVNTDTGQPIKASFGHTRATIDPLPPLQPLADDGRTQIHTDLAQRPDTYTWDSWRWDNPVQLLDVYEGIAAIDTRSTTAPPALPAIGYAPGHQGAYSGDATTAAAQPPITSTTATQSAETAPPNPRRGWTGQWDAQPWRPAFPSQYPSLMGQALAAIRRISGSIWMQYETQLGFGKPNLLSKPEDWNKYTGTDGTATVTQYFGDSPFPVSDGVSLVTKNTASGNNRFYQYATSQPYTTGAENSRTFFVKPILGCVAFEGFTAYSDAFYFKWTLATNVISVGVNTKAATVTPVNSGWYCITVTSKESATASAVHSIVGIAAGNTDAASFLSIGYKLEVGGVTDYTPQYILSSLGSYVDSAGTQTVSAVGDLMGLVLEKTSLNAGTERVVNGNFADGATGWSVGAGWAIGVGSATATNTTAALRNTGASGYLTVGKWHKVSITVSVHTAGTLYFPYDGTGLVAVPAKPGTYTYYFLCDWADYTYVYGSGFTGVITKVSVVELPVSHAVQATTANKPSAKIVPKKLGPELVTNGDFSAGTAGWSGSTYPATLSTSEGEMLVTRTAINGRAVATVQAVIGKSYQVCGWVRKIAGTTDAVLGFAQNDYGGTIATVGSTASSTPFFVSQIFVAKASVCAVTVGGNGGGPADQFGADDISVREVLEWQPAMSFDGSNDYLETYISTGKKGWLCAGVRLGAASNSTLFNAGEGSASTAGIWVVNLPGIGLVMSAGNGTTRPQAIIGGLDTQPAVVEAGWNEESIFIKKSGSNGPEIATAQNTGNCSSGANTLRIGDFRTGGFAFNGSMTAIVYCPVVPSDDDRDIISRLVGSLQGQEL